MRPAMKKILTTLLPIFTAVLIAVITDKLTKIDILGKLTLFLDKVFNYLGTHIQLPIWLLIILVLIPSGLWYLTSRSDTRRWWGRHILKHVPGEIPVKRNYPDIETLIKGTELTDELRLCVLGYQNQGPLLAYQKGLCQPDYEPGTFTLAEISPDAPFLKTSTSLVEWTEKVLNQELSYLSTQDPSLFKNKSIAETKEMVKKILTMHTPIGQTLNQEIWFQEYSDILRRIVLMVTINNPDYEIDLYPNLTYKRKELAFKLLAQLKDKKHPTLQEWLYISIAAGLLGVDEKTNHAATSEIVRTHVIPLGEEENVEVAVKSISERIWQVVNTKERVDATNAYLEILKNSSWRTFRIVSFPDDYLETIFLLNFYNELLGEFPHVEIDCVPRSIRCGNDATWQDVEEFIEHFSNLKKTPRFKVHHLGPKLGTVNLLKLDHTIMDLLEVTDIVDARGARNYEMMQGINRDAYFSFMVCREFSEAVTGLFAEDTPLVFLRQSAGEKSFSGFRQRSERKENGRMLCKVTVMDQKGKWDGGHLAAIDEWPEEIRKRYQTLNLYYGKNAVSFHKKYGDHLEIEVKDYLNYMQGNVLVLGCGSGKEVNYLASRGCNVDGIDASDEAIHIARNSYPSIWNHFRVDDMYNLNLDKNRNYDGIVANAVFVHLLDRDDIHTMIKSMKERLVPGGLGFIRLIDKKDVKQEYDHYQNATRWFVYYSLDELEKMCELIGLNIIKKDCAPHIQYPSVKWVSILFQK
jgi:2-polyprenyl-3-methyl-5-hydroxy-6-metoxy-1,4-benzoquinol methylase